MPFHYTTEIIIIDSQSEDQTINIIKEFQKIHKNIKLVTINKEDFNYGETRNLGARLAHGKYLCFISGDAILFEKNSLKFFLDDFKLNRNVVVVFGKQIPNNKSEFIQKLEFLCRFDRLDKYANVKGILIYDLKKPFIPYDDVNKFFWFWLFNTFACYKRSFILKNPFKKVSFLEDFIMGKNIVEKGLIKIYDNKCKVKHSHNLNLLEYYSKQKEDFTLMLKVFKIKGNSNLVCKLFRIYKLKKSLLIRTIYILKLFFYYTIKLVAYLDVKLSFDKHS